jgi:alpha-beta hydrolase superfamily lysophospholipase
MEPEPASAHDAAPPVIHEVERTAFYFESEGQSLFAWLHRHPVKTLNHGVLICPPVGHEQVHSHGTLRHLADRLAGEGFHVMRLDYSGIGDSDGQDKDPGRVAIWQANVRDAAGWLRQHGGCEKISLIGLRMGATLAAIHATACEVENLVLWAPMVKGSRYVRELTALSRTAAHSADSSSSIEAMGFVFTDETVQDLAQIDLLKLKPRFRHALVVLPEGGPTQSPLVDSLRQAGADVEQRLLPGYEAMMAEPHFAVVPHDTLSSITAWMCSKESTIEAPSSDGPSSSSAFASSMVMRADIPVRESIHRLSEAPCLFGISTEAGAGKADLPWLLMLNAGAAYRVGPGRLYVQLARHLATLGYPCLRMDISGIGDSVVDGTQAENDTYAATAFRDVALACDYLQSIDPGRSIVLMGLCSGAYAAFQSAAQLPHPALRESILINPLTFFWRDGMSLSESPTERLQAWHYYWKIIFDPNSWIKLFSGKTTKGFRGTLRRFMQSVVLRSGAAAHPPTQAVAPGQQSQYSHPPKEDLPADLGRVVAASRTLAMFVSESDPGHFLLMHKARRKATQLIRAGVLKCFFIKNADHTFSTESSRRALTQVLTEYLHSRFGSSGR